VTQAEACGYLSAIQPKLRLNPEGIGQANPEGIGQANPEGIGQASVPLPVGCFPSANRKSKIQNRLIHLSGSSV
jgi:hypothetical protein